MVYAIEKATTENAYQVASDTLKMDPWKKAYLRLRKMESQIDPIFPRKNASEVHELCSKGV